MFEKLRSAIKIITTTASQRTLKEEDITNILTEFELALIESDVAPVIVLPLNPQWKDEKHPDGQNTPIRRNRTIS